MSWLDNVEIVVNELVTSAVLHASTPITISLSLRSNVVHIEVTDDSAAEPLRLSGSNGRRDGLLLVAALSQNWGTKPHLADGKVMWADVVVGASRPSHDVA